jgi:ammonia channel protein AmtB
MLLAQAPFFKEQVSTEAFLDNLLYIIAATAVVLVVAALILVDMGLVRRSNVLDTAVQRLLGFLIGTLSYAIIGYGIWNWQFYDAFGVDNAYGQAIEDWWIGGTSTSTLAHELDPALFPAHNTFQIFLAFLAVYAGFVCVLVHFAAVERMKPLAYYLLCVWIGAAAYPIILWLTWGSLSPLTNAGVHDFIGVFCAYILAGGIALVLAWRLGPRLGRFKPDARLGGTPAPYNVGLTVTGVVLLLFAIPFVAIGCGYWFPDVGYFGIAMTTSGIGVIFNNVFMAYVGGAVTGAVLAYRTKNVTYALLGPLAGYVAGTAAFDVVTPWEMLVIALFAPFVVWVVHEALHRAQIDEAKVVPLGLGAGIYGAIVVGFVAWGDKTGGFLGIESGEFAFQNAEINVGWQLIGIAVTLGMAAVTGLVILLMEKTIGIRVSEEQEVEGLDVVYWNVPPAGDHVVSATESAPGSGAAAEVR